MPTFEIDTTPHTIPHFFKSISLSRDIVFSSPNLLDKRRLNERTGQRAGDKLIITLFESEVQSDNYPLSHVSLSRGIFIVVGYLILHKV